MLDSITLANTIKNNILAISYTPIPAHGSAPAPTTLASIFSDQILLTKFCTAVADAVVSTLKAEAVVTVTVAGHTHTGGTLLGGFTGPPVPGPAATETGDPVISTGGIS